MCDGYVYVLNAFYWRGDGKTMFSPILEVTTIQDGGALVKKVYMSVCLFVCLFVFFTCGGGLAGALGKGFSPICLP